MKNELSFKSQNETTPFDQKARELVGLKMALYSAPDQREVLRSINDWYTLVKAIDPACQESRLHHFLIGSTLPEGVARLDDLSGDLSAERFLRADPEEKKRIIGRLRELVYGQESLAA